MGSWLCRREAPASAGDAVPEAPPATPAPAKPRLDPKDFMVMNAKGVTVVRPPGAIAGQQFIIDTADDCDIFLFDYSAQVTVDFATNCRIFIGPCESSVFLRDCRRCRVVCACQQLRTRDCADVDLMLFCSTQPSIETTRDLRISCFQYSYFSLAEQFQSAKLSVWNNQWFRVHDFNETDGEVHYRLATTRQSGSDVLGRRASQACHVISDAEVDMSSPVPFTEGRKVQDVWFALVIDRAEQRAHDVLDVWLHEGACLLETRQGTLTKSQTDLLFLHGGTVDSALKRRATSSTLIGMRFDGTGKAPSAQDGTFVADDPQIAQYMSNCYFQQFLPTI
ncbi:C-CAP/cofactor C-like domain-containing protein [Plasmodiophora brassicae]